jgi:hypothetical protein
MKREEADFWIDILLENADYLFRKKQALGKKSAINIDELVQETINHVGKIMGGRVDEETKETVSKILRENCIGTNLWKIKEGFVIPAYYLADIFLNKARELFSEEDRRYKSVLGREELIEGVMKQMNADFGQQINAETKAAFDSFLEKLCDEYKYFKKIQNKYIIFDKSGRERLEALLADLKK